MSQLVFINPRRPIVEAAQKRGFQVLAVCESGNAAGLRACADEVLVVPSLDLTLDVVRAIHRRVPGNGICIGFGDMTTQLAAVANASLGWPSVSTLSCLEVFRDKAALRDALGREDPLNPRYAVVHAPWDELEAATRYVGFPLVLKPVDSSGSRGITAFRTPVPTAELLARCREIGERVLLEQLVAGTEISVEAMSWDGRHLLLGVTQKHTSGPPSFVEERHVFPYSLQHHGLTSEDVHRVVSRILDSAGLRAGLSHTELMICGKRMYLVESHGRSGGDRISDLVELASGVNFFDLLFSCLSGQQLPVSQPVHQAAGVQFFDLSRLAPDDGEWIARVSEVAGVIDVNVLIDRGKRGTIGCSWDRHANLVVAAKTAEEVHQRLDQTKNITAHMLNR